MQSHDWEKEYIYSNRCYQDNFTDFAFVFVTFMTFHKCLGIHMLSLMLFSMIQLTSSDTYEFDELRSFCTGITATVINASDKF